MRFVATAVALSALSFACPFVPAFGLDDLPDPLAALEAKADQAQPRDQCFLYAELVSQMTDLASHQFDAGDSGRASETLRMIQHYAEKIQNGVAVDSKKLKNAELLMQRTSYRLKDILGNASYEDRQALEATLKELDQVQSQLMLQVFKK